MENNSLEYRIRLALKITPRMAELVTALYTRPVLPIGETDVVLVHRTRLALKGRAVIETKRMLGYWLTDETRELIRKAIEPQEEKKSMPKALLIPAELKQRILKWAHAMAEIDGDLPFGLKMESDEIREELELLREIEITDEEAARLRAAGQGTATQ